MRVLPASHSSMHVSQMELAIETVSDLKLKSALQPPALEVPFDVRRAEQMTISWSKGPLAGAMAEIN